MTIGTKNVEEAEVRTIVLDRLMDITDNEADEYAQIPKESIALIRALFADSQRVDSFEPINKDNVMGRKNALIPRTQIVIKTMPFVWNSIKALMKSAAAFKLQAAGQSELAALTGGSAIESLGKAKRAIERLDPDQGEYCLYLNVVNAPEPMHAAIGMRPSLIQVIKTQKAYQTTCNRLTCKYHDKTNCTLTDAQREDVIKDLVKREILVELNGGGDLWVAV